MNKSISSVCPDLRSLRGLIPFALIMTAATILFLPRAAEATDAVVPAPRVVPDANGPGYRIGDLELSIAEALQGEIWTQDQLNTRHEARVDALDELIEQTMATMEAERRGLALEELSAADMERARTETTVKVLLGPVRTQMPAIDAPGRGPADAPITIVEFADYQCHYCARGAATVDAIRETFEGKVRHHFVDYPLPFHKDAPAAHQAAHCAAEQKNRYWAMHDLLFQDAKALGPKHIQAYAKQIRLRRGPFQRCLESGRYKERLEQGKALGRELGVEGTPAYFINGRFLSGAQPFEVFLKIVLEELATPKHQLLGPNAGAEAVAARVGKHTITIAEVDRTAALRKLQAEQVAALRDRVHEALRVALLEAESAQRGMDIEALFDLEVGAKVNAADEDQARSFFDENELGDRYIFEDVQGQIQDLLDEQAIDERSIAWLKELGDRHDGQLLVDHVRYDIPALDLEAGRGAGVDAPLRLVGFTDFDCPYCDRGNKIVAELLSAYPDSLRFESRDFPLSSIHPTAHLAARAHRCAGEQGQGWPMYDLLFAQQRRRSKEDLSAMAEDLGMDREAFVACLHDERYATQVDADRSLGLQLGVDGTPTFFLNGILVSGARPFEYYEGLIDEELKRLQEETLRTPSTETEPAAPMP